MNLIKHSLVMACLIAQSCSEGETNKAIESQNSNKPTENRLLTDERYFSKPITIPSGEVTDSQRASFAKDLESAIDETKTTFKNITIKAEAPGKAVIALYANNMTRGECELLAQSEIIQQATTIGFRTFSCEDKTTRAMFSTPIKNKRGEIQIRR